MTSASFAALAIAAPANAQTSTPPASGSDPCAAPADQRDPSANCPAAETAAGEAIAQGATTTGADSGIVVVGSRIRRNNFNGVDPVTVINRDAAVDAGFNSTAEVLQSVGVTGGTGQINDTFGGFVVEGGPGVNTLSLRGLGTTRTLILLNGRRIAPAGTRGQVGAADLNVLPTSILDRIEVLNTGASSIYGSDAVAGVVNIVTLSKFNGLAIEADITAPEVGAGASQRYSITAGTSGERFSILGSIEVFDRNRITQGDLPWTRCPQQRRLSPLGVNDTNKCWPLEEGGVTVNTIGTGFYFINNPGTDVAPGFEPNPPGYYLYCNRWRPNAANTAGTLPGFECVGGLIYNPTTGGGFGSSLAVRDTFAPSMLKQDVISPTRNYTGYLSATYDTGFFGDGQLYSELLITRRKSQQNGQRQFTLDYAPNSPLLLAANGGLFTTQPRRVNSAIGIRTFADYGIYDSSQTQDFVKFSVGFRGDLPFLPTWRYDFYANKSWADGTYSFEQILADRLAQSLNVRLVNAAGTPITTPGATIANTPGARFACVVTIGNCVPAPAISNAIIGGQARTAAAAWFDYVTDDVVGHTSFRETTFNATFDGPLFRLPGGDAQAVVGFEYRKSSINDVPSSDAQRNNLYNFTSAPITKGSDSVWEAFTELEFPVLRNVPFADELTFNASGRFTHYESYGSDTTYKIGGKWAPTRWLAFRGSYGTSYRAPALYEQFLGSTTGFLSAQSTDPCTSLFNVTNQTIVANCLADGLPNNFINNGSTTVIQQGGAAAGLEAETSKNLTFGTVIQPTFGPAFGNLSLAIDYFRIEVNNGVSQLGAGALARGCYDGTRPEYCQFVVRAPYTGSGTGQLTITQSYINVATDMVKGIDFTLRYDRELGPGKLDLGINAVRVIDRVNQNDPNFAATHFEGSIGNPKWAGTGHVGYDWGPWYARWGVEFIGKSSDNFLVDPADYPSNVYDFSVKDYWLHTFALRYEPSNRYSLTAGVRNVFDKKPPKITAEDPFVNTISNIPLQSGWDFRGRTFFINAQAKIF
ncbi:TonB-dependent receptor [Sphingomonas daechungensis]|uniref:TonB-dependent receptor n=2 Tax=Sphingomonas daechungensis TaxID=1176646 RepID=A0ABX6SZE6_9SPHN|nr:TonB-dependent receptor [Sphingomonas daechungensis]QNP42684.1 TonB-dependent receptor [Sphingomonas daechungensis]